MIVDISEEVEGNGAGIYAKRDTILEALGVVLTPSAVHELRVVKAGKYKTISGYYDRPDALADHALTLSEYERVPAVYATLNPVVPDLLARSANNFKKWAEFTTADRDVVRLRRLLIDGDPERPAGISSTDEEHDLAIARVREVRDYLVSEGWPLPMFSDSGNGAHDIFAIDLANTDGNVALCKAVLEALHARFSDNTVTIDRKTYNAARICKVPGTWARKGDDLPSRPHRLARVIDSPKVLEIVPVELLEKLVGKTTVRPMTFDQLAAGFLGGDEPFEAPDWLPDAKSHDSGPKGSWTARKLEAWFGDHDVEYRPAVEVGDRLKYVLDPCPFDETHTGKDAAVFLTIDGDEAGMVGFHCFHDGCANKTWKDLRELIAGPTTATSSSCEENAERFDERLVGWVNAKGGDGAGESWRLANGAIEAKEGSKAGAETNPKPDPYLDDLTKAGVDVGGKKVVKGSINYYTTCPCCGLVGTFWRRLEDFRCGYECSATRRSWAEGKGLWKAVNSPEGRKRRAYTLDELESLPSPGWLVQDHFAERSLVLIYGASNVGKSFFVIDLGLSVAAERSFLGRHAVRQGPVVYVVGEGAGGIRKRVKAWRKQHDVTADIPFLVVPYPFGLTTGNEEVTELVQIMKDKLGEVAPALIILDTLSRHFGPGDENATKDMKAFTDACDRLVAETGAAVAVVHHTGKDATRKERGNVTLRSNSDTVIFVDGFRGREGMEVECQKQKDAEYFEAYKLLREVVTLDGGETSLVYHLDPNVTVVSRATKPTWGNDMEMVASLAPLGRDNARSIAQIVEDVRAGMVVCQMEPIGQNRCRTVVRSLIANRTLHTVPSTTGNPNHDRYYRADQARRTSDFFADPSHGEAAS